MPQISPQDRLLMSLIAHMSARRVSPTYSTAYYHNTLILPLAEQLLPTSNSELSKILHRIIHNSQWFESHYRASLSTLQAVLAQKKAPHERRLLSGVFERDRGVRLDAGRFNEAQAERQEVELGRIAGWRGVGPEVALGSHPVGEPKVLQKRQEELQVIVTPNQGLVLQSEKELEVQGKVGLEREAVLDGVDAHMILAYWALNVAV